MKFVRLCIERQTCTYGILQKQCQSLTENEQEMDWTGLDIQLLVLITDSLHCFNCLRSRPRSKLTFYINNTVLDGYQCHTHVMGIYL